MMVYLERTKHPNLDMDSITLKDANCKLADLGDFNGTHLRMEVPLDGCMTNHTTAEDTITYANSIIAETQASQGSILISREFQAEFPFKCTYPRSAILSVASFSPREKVIYTRTGNERSPGPIPNSLCERRLQGIMVVVFIILDWIFVLMNTATMIPCRRLIGRIGHLCRLNVFALLGLRIDPESKTTTVKTVESHVYLESLNHRLKIIELCFASHTSTIV